MYWWMESKLCVVTLKYIRTLEKVRGKDTVYLRLYQGREDGMMIDIQLFFFCHKVYIRTGAWIVIHSMFNHDWEANQHDNDICS